MRGHPASGRHVLAICWHDRRTQSRVRHRRRPRSRSRWCRQNRYGCRTGHIPAPAKRGDAAHPTHAIACAHDGLCGETTPRQGPKRRAMHGPLPIVCCRPRPSTPGCSGQWTWRRWARPLVHSAPTRRIPRAATLAIVAKGVGGMRACPTPPPRPNLSPAAPPDIQKLYVQLRVVLYRSEAIRCEICHN